MRQSHRLSLATGVTALAVSLLTLSPWLAAPIAQASQGDRFSDRDGDFLPDTLEFATLLDPTSNDTDGDGVDDFMATVRYLRSTPRASDPEFRDHEMRVLLTSEERAIGDRVVFMHFLFRFPDGVIPPFEQFQPFIDQRGVTLPLNKVIGYGEIYLKMHQHPTEGLLVHAAVEIGDESHLRIVQPYEYTIGAIASIERKLMTRGVYVKAIQDLPGDPSVLTTMVPIANNQVALQTLSSNDLETSFWSSERICVLTLETFSSDKFGHTCQITEASCESLNSNVMCPPSCTQSFGDIAFFPSGFGTISGNN